MVAQDLDEGLEIAADAAELADDLAGRHLVAGVGLEPRIGLRGAGKRVGDILGVARDLLAALVVEGVERLQLPMNGFGKRQELPGKV
jgi:hypothetical protein